LSGASDTKKDKDKDKDKATNPPADDLDSFFDSPASTPAAAGKEKGFKEVAGGEKEKGKKDKKDKKSKKSKKASSDSSEEEEEVRKKEKKSKKDKKKAARREFSKKSFLKNIIVCVCVCVCVCVWIL